MFGKRLMCIREMCGMNQVEVAKHLGVSKQCVSNWENGNSMPSVEMLKNICVFFSCSADFFLGLDQRKDFLVDTSKLSLEQTKHIQALVADFEKINKQYEKVCSMVHKK